MLVSACFRFVFPFNRLQNELCFPVPMLSRFTGGAGALFHVFFQLFLSGFSEGRREVFVPFSSCFWVSLGGLVLSIFRKSTAFFEIVPAPDFRIQYSVLA